MNAEDAAQGFKPSPGTVTAYREPAGNGVRVDSAAGPGFVVTPEYDSLIAKLIVWDGTRELAFARLRRTIDDYRIDGVRTTLPFLRALSDEPHRPRLDVRHGDPRGVRAHVAPPEAALADCTG